MLKKLLLFSFSFFVSLFGGEVQVVASDNTLYALEAITKEFNKHHADTKIIVTHANIPELKDLQESQTKYDLILSEDEEFVESLYKEGKSEEPLVYAIEELALFSAWQPDYNKGLKLLEEKKITKVLILEKTEYKNAATDAMKHEKVYESAKQKSTYVHEFTPSTLSHLQENEIAIVPKSLLFTQEMQKFIKDRDWLEICSKTYVPIDQKIVMLKSAKAKREVEEVYTFFRSEEAKNILKDFRYLIE